MRKFSSVTLLNVVSSLALIVTAAAAFGADTQCINLSGTYQRYEGDVLNQRIIKQKDCTSISLTKRIVMPVWSQSKQATILSEFVITDYEMNPDTTLATMEMKLTTQSFAIKSLQQKSTPDFKTLFPVYKTTEFSLNENGDLVETWRIQDRRPGPNFNQDLVKPSVLFPLKRVQ